MADSDARLVLRTLDGQESAFAELYDRYARLIRAICHDKAGDLNIAQDLTQEVFLRAYEKLGGLKQPDRFGYWLVSIARNVCREYRRGRYRDRHQWVGLELDEFASEDHAAGKNDERLGELEKALAKLADKEKLALHIYYLQEKDLDQAQKIMGVSRSSFYRLLASARKKIEDHLGQTKKNLGQIKKNKDV